MSIGQLFKKWNSINLVYRILFGFVLGVTLALIMPGNQFIPLLGDVFVSALKSIAPFLVLLLVMGSISGSAIGIGSKFKLVVFLYIFSTVMAAAIATIMCYAFPTEIVLPVDPDAPIEEGYDLFELVSSLLLKIICNPISALIEGNYLGILLWAIIVGVILKSVASENTIQLCSDLSETVIRIVRLFIGFAPFGVFGLIYESISASGMDIFISYGHLILILIASMLIVMFISNPLIVYAVTHRNPFPLLVACIKGSALTAFFTRSSAANIPMNLALCEKLNVNKELYTTSIPLGSSINTNGAAITITIMTLTAAASMGMDVPFYMAMLLCIVSAFAACGASGVSGGSLLLIPLACSLLGIGDVVSTQLIVIGFIIGVVTDSFETALNSSADALFTIAVDIRNEPDKERNLDI